MNFQYKTYTNTLKIVVCTDFFILSGVDCISTDIQLLKKQAGCLYWADHWA